jgi:hypothetical protein
MVRGLRELLPLMAGIAIVAILLISWIRSAAKQIGSSPRPAGFGISAPTTIRPAAPATPNARLGWLAKAIQMYVADYDMRLPPMHSATRLQSLLMPYVNNPTFFIDPSSGALFGVNASLSFKSMTSLRNAGNIVIFYQTQPEPGTNKRWVAFLDGHVKQVDQKQWQQLSRQSGITAKPSKKRGGKR